MHPDDAKKRGIKRNDEIILESRRGKVKVRVATGGRNRVPRRQSLHQHVRFHFMLAECVDCATRHMQNQALCDKTACREARRRRTIEALSSHRLRDEEVAL